MTSHRRCCWNGIVAAAVLAAGHPAAADPDAIKEQHAAAIASFKEGRSTEARVALEKAVGLCLKSKPAICPGLARLFADLGVVLCAGLMDTDGAREQLRAAAWIDPKIAPSEELRDTCSDRLLYEVREEASRIPAPAKPTALASFETSDDAADDVEAPAPDAPATAGGADETISTEAAEPDAGDRPTVFVRLAFGSGVGWASGHAEVFRAYPVVSGLAWSPAFLLPEVGFYLRERISLSLALRWQVATLAGGAGDSVLRDYPDANSRVPSQAFATTMRGAWHFGAGRLRPYAAGIAGYGWVRQRLDLRPKLEYTDTVKSGGVLFGAAAGVRWRIGKAFWVSADASVLGGLGKLSALGPSTFEIDAAIGTGVDF